MDYDDKRWEYESVQSKAEALEAALGEVTAAISTWKDSIKKVQVQEHGDYYERAQRSRETKVAMYFASRLLPHLRRSLGKNGARPVQ